MPRAVRADPLTAGTGSDGAAEGGVDIYVSAVKGDDTWVSAALVCPAAQAWEYIELIDPRFKLDPSGARPAWAHDLRKVPRTVFAHTEAELFAAVDTVKDGLLGRLPAAAGAREVIYRVSAMAAFAERLVGQCRRVTGPDDALASEFTQRCNGKRAGRPHALVDALQLAVSDQERRQPLLIEEITRFELLLGTKNAQSMRAWLRERALAPTKVTRRSKPASRGAVAAPSV